MNESTFGRQLQLIYVAIYSTSDSLAGTFPGIPSRVYLVAERGSQVKIVNNGRIPMLSAFSYKR